MVKHILMMSFGQSRWVIRQLEKRVIVHNKNNMAHIWAVRAEAKLGAGQAY